jgi:hypothetical protein
VEQIIRDMLDYADKRKEQGGYDAAYETVEFAKRLIDKLAETIHAPSNWRDIGERLAGEWNDGTYGYGSWGFEELELYNYGADECFGVAAMDDGEEE